MVNSNECGRGMHLAYGRMDLKSLQLFSVDSLANTIG